jgi:hypothetical protein
MQNPETVDQTYSLSLNNLQNSVLIPFSLNQIRLPSLKENHSFRLDNTNNTKITEENESKTTGSDLLEKPKKKRGRPRKNLQ